jgi:RNA polymerase sigma-70 factor, ECF subfamily
MMTEQERTEFFTHTHNHHAGWVRKLVSRAVSGEDANDVIQNVWLAVLRSAHTYDADRGSITTWLAFIARHETANFLRDRLRVRGHMQVSDAIADRSHALPRHEREEVRRLLGSLPQRDAETLTLWARGLDSRAVATVSGEGRSATRQRLQQTLRRAKALVPEQHEP